MAFVFQIYIVLSLAVIYNTMILYLGISAILEHEVKIMPLMQCVLPILFILLFYGLCHLSFTFNKNFAGIHDVFSALGFYGFLQGATDYYGIRGPESAE